MLQLIKSPHATVGGLLTDMEQSGWVKIKAPKAGAVVVWEAVNGKSGEDHVHSGIYIGNKKAVSNRSSKGTPQIHHWTWGIVNGKPKRKIIASYWHPALGK